MSLNSKLTNLLNSFPTLVVTDEPIYFISDLHINDGSSYDNFKQNSSNFLTFSDPLVSPLFVVGDAHDLWESKEGKILSFTPACQVTEVLQAKAKLIKGNHDSKGISFLSYYPDGVHLVNGAGETIAYVFHGHQIDFWNKGGFVSNIVSWIVGHVWTKFDKSPASNKNLADRLDVALYRFATETKTRIVCGHTHQTWITRYYINCGTWTNFNTDIVKYEKGFFSLV